MGKKGLKLEFENAMFKITNIDVEGSNSIILICLKDKTQNGVFKYRNDGTYDYEKYFQKYEAFSSSGDKMEIWCTLIDGKYVQLNIFSLNKGESILIDKIYIDSQCSEKDIDIITSKL